MSTTMLGILASPRHVRQIKKTIIEEKDGGGEDDDDDDDSDIYLEPSNFKMSIQKMRRVTISDDLPTCKTNSGYKGHRRSRYSTFIAGLNQFDPYQELTATQIAAFRQVFDMVDRDGGGSIDADELYLSMKDLESGLKLEEIKEILDELDRDGNGEIDFEEFLYMMTSMSLQIKEAQEDSVLIKQGRRRQSIFFSVITKFAMKHSLKEIEHYYASKANRSPHVVGHYAAGARVFGLTDKELRKTWKEFSHASKGNESPYAQPLDFVVDDDNGKYGKKSFSPVRRQRKKIKNPSPSPTPLVSTDSTPRRASLATRNGGTDKTSESTVPAATYKIRIGPKIVRRESATPKVRRESVTSSPRRPSLSPRCPSSCAPRDVELVSVSRASSSMSTASSNNGNTEKRDGWTPRHRLPITKVKLPKFTYPQEKKLTIKDMDKIRQRVNDARNIYYKCLGKEKVNKAREYWESLKTEQIQSERLQSNFKKVFRCYSPTNDKEKRTPSADCRRKKSPRADDLESYRNLVGDFVF